MLPSSPTFTVGPQRQRLSISLAKVGVVASIDDILAAYSSAKDLLEKLKRKHERTNSLDYPAELGLPASPTSDCDFSPIERGRLGNRASQSKRLQTMLKETRLTLRAYYEAYYRLLGQTYAHGDYLALDQLKDIVVFVQREMIEQLCSSLTEDAPIDYRALHQTLISSRNMTIDALVQLHQRLAAPAPESQGSTSPVESDACFSRINSMETVVVSPDEQNIHPAFRKQSLLSDTFIPSTNSTSWAHVGKVKNALRRTQPFHRVTTINSQKAEEDMASPISPLESPPEIPDYPLASLDLPRQGTSTEQRAWWHNRSISSTSDDSQVSQVSDVFSAASSARSNRTSVSSVHSVTSPSLPFVSKRLPLRVVNADVPAANSATSSSNSILKRLSIFSTHNESTFSVLDNPETRYEDCIISKANATATATATNLSTSHTRHTLCASAHQLQANHPSQAYKPVHSRNSILGHVTSSSTSAAPHFICKSPDCRYTVPLIRKSGKATIDDKAIPVLDDTIMSKSSQIMYRHAFLFKSHIKYCDEGDGVERLRWYGCVFCADAGADARLSALRGDESSFLGEEALMLHIESAHMGEGKWPTGDVLRRMGCVIGFAGAETNWDLWLPDHYGSSSAANRTTCVGRQTVKRKPLRLSMPC